MTFAFLTIVSIKVLSNFYFKFYYYNVLIIFVLVDEDLDESGNQQNKGNLGNFYFICFKFFFIIIIKRFIKCNN